MLGVLLKIWKNFLSLYLIILTDEKKHCGFLNSAVHNTIFYSNDCGNYVAVCIIRQLHASMHA